MEEEEEGSMKNLKVFAMVFVCIFCKKNQKF